MKPLPRLLLRAAAPAAAAAAVTALIAVSTAGASTTATIPPGSLHGCVVGSSRTLEHVYSNPASGTTCAQGWQAIWNIKGPKGATGATGPAGPQGPQGPSGVVAANVTDFPAPVSVNTGGSFVTNATQVGQLTLQPGTYLVSVSAKATPSAPTGAVDIYPGLFLYNQPANANFTGDVLNIGSGHLEDGANANIDSYYSGDTLVTVTQATQFTLYAFGYDSDRGASSYTLDDATVSTVSLNPAS